MTAFASRGSIVTVSGAITNVMSAVAADCQRSSNTETIPAICRLVCRGLMDDIMSDFEEWESEKQLAKEKTVKESDTKNCVGAVVRDSAMQRLREQRLVDAKRAADNEEKDEALPTDTMASSCSKETLTKVINAILASLVPLMES
ncbi:hypothetical protein PHYPSEUDO_011355 [Phytophthora pseudosyringae]|uniref:Uncharacterized protein n=1 Tax=Phytophthora pseudosyringae TaxID=221518 RepID=A0A8T1W726_9STRA|nr:hypothetical protein PHYPSEUDO_011355 [Phytophthora pseudosyringae]